MVDENKILVVSDLNKKENEQVIFDTINSTGVKLTASDIIKNALFQKIKLSGKSLENFYSETWQKCFEDSSVLLGLRTFCLYFQNTAIMISLIRCCFAADIHPGFTRWIRMPRQSGSIGTGSWRTEAFGARI